MLIGKRRGAGRATKFNPLSGWVKHRAWQNNILPRSAATTGMSSIISTLAEGFSPRSRRAEPTEPAKGTHHAVRPNRLRELHQYRHHHPVVAAARRQRQRDHQLGRYLRRRQSRYTSALLCRVRQDRGGAGLYVDKDPGGR